MPSPHRERRRPAVLVPCGTGCTYAESVPAIGADWFWCRRPEAEFRLVRADRDCDCFAAHDFDLPVFPPTGLPGRTV